MSDNGEMEYDHGRDYGAITPSSHAGAQRVNRQQSGNRTIKASDFKAKCLKLMDEVAENGQEIVITKNGKPVGQTGCLPGKAQNALWHRSGKLEILGDVVSPINVEWEAESNPDRVLNP